jgi:cobalt-zinc-cadmium resistance protein CzcA
MRGVPGIEDLGLFRVLGQPNVNLIVDRAKADRFGINVADVQDAIETAVGGKAVSEMLTGEERFDLVVRYQEPFRRTMEDIASIRILAPSGERVALGELCDIRVEDGASMVYREANSRYIAIKYSVRGRDLGGAVTEAMRRVDAAVQLPQAYSLDWAGEYESQKRADQRLAVIIPITILVILLLLHTAFGSFKWALLVLVNLLIAPIGGLLALLLTGTHLSVSSGIGFLALFGVSVEIGLILVQYINQLRARGLPVRQAVIKGATRRLRPIMMTMLVATLGLLPAALSHDIGSDSQRPFAIVIVGGLCGALVISVLLLPTLYTWIARPGDRLPAPDAAVLEG